MIDIISIDEFANKDFSISVDSNEITGVWPPFDPVCILALEVLEGMGENSPTQQKINEAEKITRSILKIMQCEATLSNIPVLRNVFSKNYRTPIYG